jgi:hypothetical protein
VGPPARLPAVQFVHLIYTQSPAVNKILTEAAGKGASQWRHRFVVVCDDESENGAQRKHRYCRYTHVCREAFGSVVEACKVVRCQGSHIV